MWRKGRPLSRRAGSGKAGLGWWLGGGAGTRGGGGVGEVVNGSRAGVRLASPWGRWRQRLVHLKTSTGQMLTCPHGIAAPPSLSAKLLNSPVREFESWADTAHVDAGGGAALPGCTVLLAPRLLLISSSHFAFNHTEPVVWTETFSSSHGEITTKANHEESACI